MGRRIERALLEEQLGLSRDGLCPLVILGGEAGIGKTTLARYMADRGRSLGFQVLVGQSHDLMAAAPYGPWLGLLDRLQQEREDVTPPPVFAGNVVGDVASPVEVFGQVREFLRGLTKHGPILLILEDTHWADPASLELLRAITLQARPLPLALLVTYRVDEMTQQNPFHRYLPALVQSADGLRIDLKPFLAGELRELVDERYRLPEAEAGRLVIYLERHAEGNPFFTHEVLRALEGNGSLRRDADRWRLEEPDQFVVPSLVRQVIESRIDRLAPDTRDALAVAAVIGHVVPLALWADVAGLDESSLFDIVERAVEASLLVAAADGLTVQFVHAITRQTLYQGMLPPRRRRIHETVAARLLEGRQPDPDPVAYHLQQAGNPAALEWLVAAGERAQRAYAWLTARDRFRAAAALLEDDADQVLARARLLYSAGRLQRYSNAADGIADLIQAVRLADRVGDRVLRFEGLHSQGLLRCFADDWEAGIAQMEAGVVGLESLDQDEARLSWSTQNWMADALPLIELPTENPEVDGLIEAHVSHRRGSLPWFQAACGRLETARSGSSIFLQQVEAAGTGPVILAASGHALFGRGVATACAGEPEEAGACLQQARANYERLDHHAVVAFSLLTELNDVIMPWFTTNIPAREAAARQAAVALEKGGGALPPGVPDMWTHLPLMYLDGDWDRVRMLAANFAPYGTYILRRQATRTLPLIALHQGDQATAWNLVLGLLPAGPATRPGTAVLLDALLLQTVAIELCLASGSVDEARLWLDAQDRWLDWSGSVLGRAGHLLARGWVERAAGATDAAERLVTDAIGRASDPDQPLVLLAARRCLAELMLDRHDTEAAMGQAHAAIVLAEAVGSPYERACGQDVLARALVEQDPATARETAQAALATMTTLQATPAIQRLEALLARTGGQRADPLPPAGLTSREVEVLALLAEGLTDAGIGDRLYISPRTVSQHLRSIYSKVGVKSRSGATRYAFEHGLV